MAWTRMAEGEDAYATGLVADRGYLGALEWVRVTEARAVEDPGLAISLARWKQRYDEATFEADRNRSLLGFLMPGDEHWPAQLDDLGEMRPLGLWYRGESNVLRRMGVSVVGSRDSSAYGRRIATDMAYELADSGLNVVSGGAFGIDAAAHRGALAADGYTVAVAACGADRFYPASHGDLYLEILRRGGVICSEAPPGAAPLKHRFLSRNRIIAALSAVTVVVEAPYRSGALSSARHALSIGRPVSAVPGPITSSRSVGCHRLLRESAVCVTSAAEVVELLGTITWQASWRGARPSPVRRGGSDGAGEGDGAAKHGGAGEEEGAVERDGDKGLKDAEERGLAVARPGAERAHGSSGATSGVPSGQLELDVSTDPLAARIVEAFPLSRATTAEKIAVVAGLSISEVLSGLGRLERAHAVTEKDGAWRLVRRRKR
ncbi:MAG: DNA-processing protein DprA [Actinomycetaceae bacterium]|nr:DNA-processing protein DprA [Actinomycetaceae bacterium]